MLEDLVIFGKGTADPWNRFRCCESPVLALIEFCQLQGPKPLVSYPETPGPHLDLDFVAMWILSSESVYGSTAVLFNQQLGLYALVHHSMLLDLTARAFQRPFAVAFLTPEKPSAKLCSDFRNAVRQLLGPLLMCNRRMFWRFSERIGQLSDSDYEVALGGAIAPSLRAKMASVAEQASYHARKVSGRLAEAHSSLGDEDSTCACGLSSDEFFGFLPVFKEQASAELRPFFELGPCGKESFARRLKTMHDGLTMVRRPKGAVYSAGAVVLQSHSRLNAQVEASSSDEECDPILREFPNENSLKSLSGEVTQCLYPLLAGDRIAILASSQRKSTAADALQKLNSLKVRRREETARWMDTTDVNSTMTMIPSSQLVGVTCGREESLQWHNPTIPVVLDLNAHRIRCREYIGRLLADLGDPKKFPSDSSYLKHIVAVITDICHFVMVTRSLPPASRRRLNLSIPDQQIIANCLTELDIAAFNDFKKMVAELSRDMPYRVKKI